MWNLTEESPIWKSLGAGYKKFILETNKKCELITSPKMSNEEKVISVKGQQGQGEFLVSTKHKNV